MTKIKDSIALELKSQGIDYQSLNKNQEEPTLLQKMYLLAAKAICKTKKEEFISYNYMARPRAGKIPQYTREEYKFAKQQVENQRDDIRGKSSRLIRNNFIASLELAKAAQESHFGNCDEMASAIFFYLHERLDPNVPLEKLAIRGGNDDDHIILVMGRAANSSINDPLTWGENAVIIDPWSYSFYSVREFFEREVAYDGHYRGVPEVREFDSSKDRIEVLVSRFLQSNELGIENLYTITPELQKHLNHAKELLKDFHHAATVNDRQKKAQELFTYINGKSFLDPSNKKIDLKELYFFRLLSDQMDYFFNVAEGFRFYPSKKHPDAPAFAYLAKAG